MKALEAYLFLLLGIAHMIAGVVLMGEHEEMGAIIQYVGGLGYVIFAAYHLLKAAGPQKSLS
jgi:hypothetical protein